MDTTINQESRQAEEAVLAAILIETDAINDVINILTEDSFYYRPHQKIWSAVKQLYYSHDKIESITVMEKLKRTGELEFCGGAPYLVELCNKIGSTANIVSHARILQEKWISRRLNQIGIALASHAQNVTYDPFELLQQVSSQLDSVNSTILGQANSSFTDRVYDTITALNNAYKSGTSLSGIPTFSRNLNRAITGFQPSDLIILAARPSMGKTSLALFIALNQAKNDDPVGFFSLEMNDRQLINKMLSAECGINLNQINTARVNDRELAELNNTANSFYNLKFELNDTGALNIDRLISITKNWVRKCGVKVIYIDYLQLITTGSVKKFGTREQEVSYITSKLKAAAKELNITIVALSQLSREVEKRSNKRPLLSDLRESGSIEQDADIVLFPFSPENLGLVADESGNKYEKGFMVVDVAKYRNGATGEVHLRFIPELSKFEDYE